MSAHRFAPTPAAVRPTGDPAWRLAPPRLAEADSLIMSPPLTRRDPLAAPLASAAGGDQNAFATLYDALSPVVFGTCRRVLRDQDLAAETTQDVFVEIWRSAGRYDPSRGTVRTWAATLAHRRAVDRVRSIQAERDRDQADAARSHVPAHDPVGEEVADRAEASRVTECLDGLTDTQRESVTLAYWGSYTYREVAERLGAALPTIKSRIRDGLRRLRECLEPA